MSFELPGYVYGEYAYGEGIYSYEQIQIRDDEVVVPPLWTPAGCHGLHTRRGQVVPGNYQHPGEIAAPPIWSASGCRPLDNRRAT